MNHRFTATYGVSVFNNAFNFYPSIVFLLFFSFCFIAVCLKSLQNELLRLQSRDAIFCTKTVFVCQKVTNLPNCRFSQQKHAIQQFRLQQCPKIYLGSSRTLRSIGFLSFITTLSCQWSFNWFARASRFLDPRRGSLARPTKLASCPLIAVVFASLS